MSRRKTDLQEASGRKAKRPPSRPVRDSALTRSKLLQAAQSEFCSHGYSGARIESICRHAGVNIRMAYHHFGSKEGLYKAVLEAVYVRVREDEAKLNLRALEPVAGMSALVEFTFDHLIDHPEFVRMVMGENLIGAKFLRETPSIAQMAQPLVAAITDVLRRGQKSGLFRQDVDPIQLYVSILSLGMTHLTNRHTLSVMFALDLSSPEWLAERRNHAREVILSYLERKHRS